MCTAVIVLSLLAAIDPVRIGITALLISRPRPMLNLLAFWLGGMGMGFGLAFAALVYLRDVTLSIMRVVISASRSPIVVYIQVAIGVVAVAFAALLVARFRARRRSPVPVSAPAGSSRLSIRGRLESASLVAAFVAGVALATPPVEYMAAIVAIVASEPSASAQVGAALMFTIVAFTVVEIPLITYLTAPAQTLALVRRINDWISQRRQAIPGLVVGAIGFMLLMSGMGRV